MVQRFGDRAEQRLGPQRLDAEQAAGERSNDRQPITEVVLDDTAGIIWRVIDPAARPNPAIAPLEGASLPPRRDLTDPRNARFADDYARQ